MDGTLLSSNLTYKKQLAHDGSESNEIGYEHKLNQYIRVRCAFVKRGPVYETER